MQPSTAVHSPWMSRTQLVALAIATILAGTIAAIGMLASFHTVSTQMQPSFKGWAWTVPVTLDASIASFSILECRRSCNSPSRARSAHVIPQAVARRGQRGCS